MEVSAEPELSAGKKRQLGVSTHGANLSLVGESITFTSFMKDILTAALEDGELSTKGHCPLGSQEEHVFPPEGRVAIAAQICLEPFPNYQNQVV